jgi:acetyl esterase/lipase
VSGLRVALGCALAIALSQSTLAQDPATDLRRPLPPIAFDPWKQASETDNYREYTSEFPSVVQSEYPVNDVVPVRSFVPKSAKGPAPVVLVLHYWGAKDLKVERALADQLASRGIGAVIMTLPYHLGRTPSGARSGELAIRPDPVKMRATMIQATLDAKRAIDFIMTRPEFDSSKMGITGTSLGALVSALVYGTDSRLNHAAFILGGVDLAQIVWSSSLLVEVRDGLRRKGYTETRLRNELVEVEPLTYLGSRLNDSAFIIGGKYDTVIPNGATEALIGSFANPRTLWLDTGHYGGIFVQSRILKEVARYFQTEYAGKAFEPPKRIYAPTLRIGIQANTMNGFDIGVGIDIWKSNQRGDITATGLLTPRGPQLFLGARIANGISFGGIAGTRNVGVGIFWSRVL